MKYKFFVNKIRMVVLLSEGKIFTLSRVSRCTIGCVRCVLNRVGIRGRCRMLENSLGKFYENFVEFSEFSRIWIFDEKFSKIYDHQIFGFWNGF